MLNLTDVERRILINQSRLLAALYPLEAAEFERTVKILSEGYQEGWQEVVLKGLKAPLLKEDMNFVSHVLEMYDWLQKSFYALSLADKLHIKEQALAFPGFCPETEQPYIAYATFLLETFDRFAYVEVLKPLHTLRPMREVYDEMLRELSNFGGSVMTAAQLKAVIAYTSAVISMPGSASSQACQLKEAC
jgi:uncharacterized protein YfbU (UPF0304 family)